MRTLERNRPFVRRLHTAVYFMTFALLITGWWLLAGREGQSSFLSAALHQPDTTLHEWFGWTLAALVLLAPLAGLRGVKTLLQETFRYDRGDAQWLLHWPKASLLGRFARHAGHFDPGQRIANVVIVFGGLALIASGAGLGILSGGPMFVWLHRIHQWTTIVVTPVLAGHVLIALGVLPGYRGVWRSMHFGGRVPIETAQRIWPAWTERTLDDGAGRPRTGEVRPDLRTQPSNERGAVR